MNVLGTGLSGMVGGTIVDLLQPMYTFQNLSLEVGVDITDPTQVKQFISQSDAEWVLHFAAKTQVDDAEVEKHLGVDSSTWKVNVLATQIVADACRLYNKKLLYISTDFVFPGGDHVFTEEDKPNPIGWYAQTKYEGETIATGSGIHTVVMRIAFPYGQTTGSKKDFVGRLREMFESDRVITAPIDQLFTPTYIPDIAAAIHVCMTHNASGVFHVVGSSSLSSYDAALNIAAVFGYNSDLVKQTTVKEYYANRAARATMLKISNAKYVSTFGLSPLPFHEGIQQLKANQK